MVLLGLYEAYDVGSGVGGRLPHDVAYNIGTFPV